MERTDTSAEGLVRSGREAVAGGSRVVVALRALKLGDLLVAVPALHALRRGMPDARLILAAPAWLAPVVALVGDVDALVDTPGLDAPLRLPVGSVDTVVNLHGRGPRSTRLLDALRPRRRIGHAGAGWPGPAWVDGMHERDRWARLLGAHGMPADPGDVSIRRPHAASPAPGAVVVHVGAFYGCRRWPVSRFGAVARGLRDAGERVVLTGSRGERARALAVARQAGVPLRDVLAGRQSLARFAAVVADARAVVSADTGAAHLATAYARLSVVLFGPAPPEQWGPPSDGRHVVLTDARLRRGDAFCDTPDPALLAVQPGDILAALRELLAPRRGEGPPVRPASRPSA